MAKGIGNHLIVIEVADIGGAHHLVEITGLVITVANVDALVIGNIIVFGILISEIAEVLSRRGGEIVEYIGIDEMPAWGDLLALQALPNQHFA